MSFPMNIDAADNPEFLARELERTLVKKIMKQEEPRLYLFMLNPEELVGTYETPQGIVEVRQSDLVKPGVAMVFDAAALEDFLPQPGQPAKLQLEPFPPPLGPDSPIRPTRSDHPAV